MPATRLTLGDYHAWIKIAGQEIEHHSIEINEEEKLASCWIASEEGKAFTIDFQKTHVNHACGFSCYVDGEPVSGKIQYEGRTHPDSLRGTRPKLDTEKPFIFASLTLTDDDSFLTSADSAKDIGEIKVDIHRLSNIQLLENPTYLGIALSEDKKVHEREKKATEHRVRSGQEVKVPTRTLATFQRHEKLATFIFRYRSLRMLQANGLVAREPTPVEGHSSSTDEAPTRKRKLEVKEESEDEDEDPEELEVKRKEAELVAQLEDIRNARDIRRQTKPPKKKVKEESKPVFLRGEVIDLT